MKLLVVLLGYGGLALITIGCYLTWGLGGLFIFFGVLSFIYSAAFNKNL